MAYSSVRVQFEIGHEASVRTKKTPDGFTHDWEVFVKGADNTDIQYFVDKVVFHLHETFPKPRRVIKEPPYSVKESGYAGFVLPIDVYLKNKEEPKKISFNYDLTLQNSGPPISRVLREPRVFQNPSEDFRRKLIRGGGVGVDTPSEVSSEDHKPSPSLGSSKSKPVESPNRKHKPEFKVNDSFAELFGPPIRRITPEPKKVTDIGRKLLESDKDKKRLQKSHKDEKETPKEKDKYSDRDRGKERDKSKDKSSRPQPPLGPPPPPVRQKEDHKKHEEKERKKEDYEEKKKRKDDREKKEKHKESKEVEKQEIKKEKKEPRETNDYIKKLNSSKSHDNRVPSEKLNTDSEKERSEKEKHKHRHKKKEKEKNKEKEKHKKDKEKNEYDPRERNRDKEKLNKKKHDEGKDRERKKSRTPSPQPEKMKKGPLNALLFELGSSDSASPLSEDEDSIPSFKVTSKLPAKTVPENKTTMSLSPRMKSTNLNDKDMEKHQKTDEGKNKRDKSPGRKGRKNDLDADKKRLKEHRRRSTSSEKEDEDEKLKREEAEFEKELAEKERLEEEKAKQIKKEKESNRKRKKEKGLEQRLKKDSEGEINLAASQTEPLETQDDSRKPEKFTKEYVAQLRDLQHRIMTLEDNDDLQRVVQVIAETGQYEITKKTFDFDLCALDSDTIRRLQECFSPT